MSGPDRSPGWDKRVVNRIAREEYGSLKAMFEAHGWSADGRRLGQIAPTRVVETYGSVAAFEKAHELGADGNAVLNPKAAIFGDTPDVWLTSAHDFDPSRWGMLAFTEQWMRDRFVDESRPGALVVIYGTNQCVDPAERGKILGVQQQTHLIGSQRDFIPAERYADGQRDVANRHRWQFGVKAIRAWRVPPQLRPDARTFFPETLKPGMETTIGARGRRLSPEEAQKLLLLDLEEVEVFGGASDGARSSAPAYVALSPSRQGPVSKAPFMVREAEGPKHIYILKLEGDIQPFLDEPADGRMIVKYGMSQNPQARCKAFNAALPGQILKWHVLKTSEGHPAAPFPTSEPALAGEAAIYKSLMESASEGARSLGNEFFLTGVEAVEQAWTRGVAVACDWKTR